MHEFVQSQRLIDIPGNLTLDQQTRVNMMVFAKTCEFMRDSAQFPIRIRNGVELFMQLLSTNNVSLFVTNRAPNLTYSAEIDPESSRRLQQFSILMPLNYAQQVREDPIANMMKIAELASRARDFFSKKDYPGFTNERGLAYSAEAVIAITKGYENEGFPLYLGMQHTYVHNVYPEGLNSLAPEEDYNEPTIGGMTGMN